MGAAVGDGQSRARVLVDCDARTLVTPGARAEAIAWRGDRLIAVGARDEVTREAGRDAETSSAGGATVLPGFIDAHHHACIAALYGGTVRLVPPVVTDIPSLQHALATASKLLPPGQWLVATDWDELLLVERRAPTRAELDDAVPDRPLLAMHYSNHRALANARALELAKIDASTPEPSGGAILRGPHGVPNGLLVERGMSRVEALARESQIANDADGFFERLGRHQDALLGAGITCVVDAAVPTDLIALVREAARRGAVRVPMVLMPTSTTGWLEAPWDALDGPITGTKDGVLTIGPVKLVFDGAPGCAMCLGWWQLAGFTVRSWVMALQQGSLDVVRTSMSTRPRLGAQIRTGIQIFRREEARDVIGAAVERGFAIATHAIGNEAVDITLSTYEAIGGERLSGAGTARIEHATFLDPELVRRIAGVGAAVVTQPYFTMLPTFASAPSVPGLRGIPLRWLLDAGVKVAASSDFPVAGFNPLEGLRAAVSRRTARGHVYEADQRVSLDEAIAMYTRTAAEVSGFDDRGTLAAGKRADLVVLDRALASDDDLERVHVHATVLGGALVFGASHITRAARG
jgi:predicted amidohydrolase YtcJ